MHCLKVRIAYRLDNSDAWQIQTYLNRTTATVLHYTADVSWLNIRSNK